MEGATPKRREELLRMESALLRIRNDRPETFVEALQLFWLYALLAGVINYGRMDDVLGPFLARDLRTGHLTESEAFFSPSISMDDDRKPSHDGERS